MKAKRSTIFKPVMLSLAVSGLMYTLSAPQALANDMDIYRPAVEGKTTLVLMLDTSGSMGSTDPGQTGTRLARLKAAMNALMDSTAIKNDVVLGIAQFSSQSRADGSSMSADGQSGKILVPARPLDATQRAAIKAAIAGLSAAGNTPTAQAYAEAGAYLMGTNTRVSTPVRTVVYAREGSKSRYFKCISNGAPERSGSTWYRYCTGGFGNQQSSAPVSGASDYYTQDDYRYYYTIDNEDLATGGSGFDYSATATKSGDQYLSPLPARSDNDECNGQGVYFLTDGEPNTSNTRSTDLMSSALQNGSFSTAGGLPNNGALSNPAWPATGAFSKFLFNKNNPAGVAIKTAVVGFGSVFAGITTRTLENPANGKDRVYYDCGTATSDDSRNACNWGEKTHPSLPGVGGFGQGGFYYAGSTQDIVNSVLSFIDELKIDIPAVPTGAIVIPQDTLAPDSLQSYAYLPLLEPKPNTSTVVWPGNVKKYDVKNGTIYGKNGQLVFNGGGTFADNTYDRWSVDNVADKGTIQKGGAFERLPMPTATNSLVRNVWIELNAASKTLDQVKPTVTDINALGGGSTPRLTNWQRRYLLNFMGYDVPEASSIADPVTTLPAKPTEPFRVMGGIVHSTPQLMTYSANLEEDGSLSSTRDESLLFGSLEGALHVVNANTGVEQLAFIPRQVIDNQARALRPDTNGLLSPDNLTVFPNPTAVGVDAPWTAYAEYSRSANKIKADFMYAYGGMRMGGNAFYGMDFTSRTSPKMLFNITPATSGFARLGQTWGKPVVTRIRYNNQTRLVVIISGGYDTDYEKTDKNRNASTDVKGNAIYIVDAKTGELLLTVGKTGEGSGVRVTNAEIKFSVVGRVKTLDRDADGLTDHLYFADLGGQVFRVDLQNAPNTATANFGTRVVRVANLTTANDAGKPGPRFYEAPVVTIHDQGDKRFAVINVGAGDRSNPLYDENTIANRVYGVIDRDVTRNDLYSTSIGMNSQNIELSALIEKPTTIAQQAAMLSDGVDRKDGWYYPLEGFGSTKTGLKGLKAFNEGAAIRSDLYMAVYNPNITNNGANKCSAQVLGATELHRYCLPFGVCGPDKNGVPRDNLQRFKLGQGIQAVNFGPGDNSQTRRLIYQQPTTGVVNQENNTATKQHTEYSAPPRLVPIRWYEKQPKLNP